MAQDKIHGVKLEPLDPSDPDLFVLKVRFKQGRELRTEGFVAKILDSGLVYVLQPLEEDTSEDGTPIKAVYLVKPGDVLLIRVDKTGLNLRWIDYLARVEREGLKILAWVLVEEGQPVKASDGRIVELYKAFKGDGFKAFSEYATGRAWDKKQARVGHFWANEANQWIVNKKPVDRTNASEGLRLRVYADGVSSDGKRLLGLTRDIIVPARLLESLDTSDLERIMNYCGSGEIFKDVRLPREYWDETWTDHPPISWTIDTCMWTFESDEQDSDLWIYTSDGELIRIISIPPVNAGDILGLRPAHSKS